MPPKKPRQKTEEPGSIMGWVSKILPRLNWPAAFVVIALLAFYGIFLAPRYITAKDLDEAIAKHHPAIDIKLAVHETALSTLSLVDSQTRDDIRDIRNGRQP